MQLFVYDVECSPQEWIITFYNIESKEWIVFHNEDQKLIDWILKHKNTSIFIGFNNKYFDAYCVKCIYYGINPYRIVLWSIIEKNNPWNLPELKYKKNIVGFINLDLTDDLGSTISLKEIEGNLGMEIAELDENFFSFGGKYSSTQLQEMIGYNKKDVLATLELFNIRENKEKFLSIKKLLCEFGNIPITNVGKSLPGIMAELLKCKSLKSQDSGFQFRCPPCIKLKNDLPIKEFEKLIFNWDTELEFTHTIQDLPITYALGGFHGALEKYTFITTNERLIGYADVKQLYPHIMANRKNPYFRYYPRTIKNWELIANLIDARDYYKKSNQPDYADSIKLGCNILYGSTLAKNYLFTDWPIGRTICIIGQLIGTMLTEILSNIFGVKIIQVNTDGIIFEFNRESKNLISKAISDFDNELGLEIKLDVIENGKIIQKDVNDYILYDKDKDLIKTKGKEVLYIGDYKSNSCKIIPEAVVKYLVYNIPVNQTILEAYNKNEVIKFQMVYARKGKNYTNTYWGDKIVQKVNRVFPTLDNLPHLTKMKDGVKHRFQNIPEHCYLDNRNVKEINLNQINLDLGWYNKKATDWIERYRK